MRGPVHLRAGTIATVSAALLALAACAPGESSDTPASGERADPGSQTIDWESFQGETLDYVYFTDGPDEAATRDLIAGSRRRPVRRSTCRSSRSPTWSRRCRRGSTAATRRGWRGSRMVPLRRLAGRPEAPTSGRTTPSSSSRGRPPPGTTPTAAFSPSPTT